MTDNNKANPVEEIREAIIYASEKCPHDGEALADFVVDWIRRHWSGDRISIPKIDERVERNAAIRREFHGSNISEICERYGVSRATVYRIVNRDPHKYRAKKVSSPGGG